MTRNQMTVWIVFVLGVAVMLMGDWAPRWIEWFATGAIWFVWWSAVGEWMRTKFAPPQRRHNDRLPE